MSSTFPDIDPSTGETIAEVLFASPDEVEAAAAAARAAADAWSAEPIEERAARLKRFGELLAAEANELGALMTREMGKTLRSAVGEVKSYAGSVAEEVDQVVAALAPERPESSTQDVTVVREPLGVVAAITPWNFPVGMPLSILTPALVAGNAVVFKPSEHTPLVGARLAELLQQVLPAGVL